MLRQGTPPREFADAGAMRAHYRALQARIWAPRAIRPSPDHTRSRTATEALAERQQREAAERAAAMLEDQARVRALAAQVLTPEHLAREPRHIITQIAETFGYTYADIVGPRQMMPLVRARWAAIAAVRAARPDLSISRLGRTFGDRDHTTIRHALAKVAADGVPQPPPPSGPA